MAGPRALRLVLFCGLFAMIAGAIFWFGQRDLKPGDSDQDLRILAYSSFTSSWGPGPRLAKMFEEKMRTAGKPVSVVLLQAEDAGLLLAKMSAFPADIVLGFDQIGKRQALKLKEWRPHGVKDSRYSDSKFLAFDWAPLGFVYRNGEIEPPKNFSDLLAPRFAGTIALQDPRSSSPGFQFLNWLVKEMGETEAFEFLRRLKPNVHSMSGSWSQAYGLFTRDLAKITFSYATSLLYHRLSEKDDRYRFALFSVGHPIQVEYAAISNDCRNCEMAQAFMQFLVENEAQNLIMNLNWMFPVNESVMVGTPFETLMKEITSSSAPFAVEDNANADELLKHWREAVL